MDFNRILIYVWQFFLAGTSDKFITCEIVWNVSQFHNFTGVKSCEIWISQKYEILWKVKSCEIWISQSVEFSGVWNVECGAWDHWNVKYEMWNICGIPTPWNVGCGTVGSVAPWNVRRQTAVESVPFRCRWIYRVWNHSKNIYQTSLIFFRVPKMRHLSNSVWT